MFLFAEYFLLPECSPHPLVWNPLCGKNEKNSAIDLNVLFFIFLFTKQAFLGPLHSKTFQQTLILASVGSDPNIMNIEQLRTASNLTG